MLRTVASRDTSSINRPDSCRSIAWSGRAPTPLRTAFSMPRRCTMGTSLRSYELSREWFQLPGTTVRCYNNRAHHSYYCSICRKGESWIILSYWNRSFGMQRLRLIRSSTARARSTFPDCTDTSSTRKPGRSFNAQMTNEEPAPYPEAVRDRLFNAYLRWIRIRLNFPSPLIMN